MLGKGTGLRGLIVIAIGLIVSTAALATNGMYLAGYGSEAAGRGGANIAVADRALGLQANPAGIAQLMGNHFSVDLQMLMPELRYYGDPMGNDIDGESQTFFMPSFSYVRGGRDTKWTWGIGLVSQGGMGANFKGYQTPFGTTDDTDSEVRFATLIPTVAYSFNEDLSIGLSANVGYSDVRFAFYPDTSVYMDMGTPDDPSDDFGFFGPKMTDPAVAFNYSFRVGLMWAVDPKLQFGLVYQTKTKGDYENGNLQVDMSSIGLGKVNYDAEVGNFTWPEQYGIGVQYRPGQKWVLALDVKQFNWSDAIETIQVVGTNPDNSMSPFPQIQMPFVFNWKDQTVFALGAERRMSDKITLRAGYNHGDSPVPDETLNPMFPATVEDHATLGLGWNFGNNTMNFAVERGFQASQTNPNTDPNVNPFGPGASVDHSQWTISIGYSKAFGR